MSGIFITTGIALVGLAALASLVLLVVLVRDGRLARGYTTAPALVLAHLCIWAAVAVCYRSLTGHTRPSAFATAWSVLIHLQTVFVVLIILLHRWQQGRSQGRWQRRRGE